jgi:hypothetical protein
MGYGKHKTNKVPGVKEFNICQRDILLLYILYQRDYKLNVLKK